HNSIVAVTNAGTKLTTARLTLHYNSGAADYVIEQPILPGDQMWLNFADIIRTSKPDKNGRVLPASLNSGTYDLREINGERFGSLFEGKLIVDKTYGHLTYGCMICCGFSTAWLDPDLNLKRGDDGNIDVEGTNDCSGEIENLTWSYYQWGTWWTDNSSVATEDIAVVHGVDLGDTNGRASANVVRGDGAATEGHAPCPLLLLAALPALFEVAEVEVLTADIVSDTIQVKLSGSNAIAGTLNVVLQRSPSGSVTLASESNRQPGTYTYHFGRTSLTAGDYTTVTATWTIPSGPVSGSKSVAFKVLGTYRHSQYNTVQESQCTGAAAAAYITNNSCAFDPETLRSDFISQTNLNGSGQSINFGLVLKEAFCLGQT